MKTVLSETIERMGKNKAAIVIGMFLLLAVAAAGCAQAASGKEGANPQTTNAPNATAPAGIKPVSVKASVNPNEAVTEATTQLSAASAIEALPIGSSAPAIQAPSTAAIARRPVPPVTLVAMLVEYGGGWTLVQVDGRQILENSHDGSRLNTDGSLYVASPPVKARAASVTVETPSVNVNSSPVFIPQDEWDHEWNHP